MDQATQTSTSNETIAFSSTLSPEEVDKILHAENIKFFVSLVPTLVCLTVLMVAGVAGNSLVLFVYYKKTIGGVTRNYILAMAVCDLLTNVLALPADFIEIRFHNTFHPDWVCKLTRTVKSFLAVMSACLMVAVAINRYLKICAPNSSLNSSRCGRLTAIIIFFQAVVMTLPYTILTGRKDVHIEGTSIRGSKCSIAEKYRGSTFLFSYNIASGLMFLTYVFIMVGAYARIARQIWRHKKENVYASRNKNSIADIASATFTDEGSEAERGVQPAKAPHVELLGLRTFVDNGSIPICDSTSGVQPHEPMSTTETDQILDRGSSGNGTGGLKQDDSGKNSSTGTSCLSQNDSRGASSVIGSENRNSSDGSADSPRQVKFESTCPSAKTESKPLVKSPSSSSHTVPQSSINSDSFRWQTSTNRSMSSSSSFKSSRRNVSVRRIPSRTTYMMFVLTVVFILNYLPYLVIVIVRPMYPGLQDHMGLNLYHICLRSYFINSAVNPVVYSFFSDRFRLELRRLIKCRRPF